MRPAASETSPAMPRRARGAAPALSRGSSAPLKPAISRQWSSGPSLMPLRDWCGVALALTEPIDHAVEPPSCEFFSMRTHRGRRARLDRGGKPAGTAADHHDVVAVVLRSRHRLADG